MCQKLRTTRRPVRSIDVTRERLAFALVILFIIVPPVVVLFPQTISGEVLVIITRLLELVISFYFRREDA